MSEEASGAATKMRERAKAPFRHAEFLPVDLEVRRDAGGTILLASRQPAGSVDANIARAVLRQAGSRPDQAALLARGGDGAWHATTYGALAAQIRSTASWLTATLAPRSVIMIIAENAVPVAVLTFAAFAAGMIVCPVSPAYAQAGDGYARLRHVLGKVAPAAILADAAPRNAVALAACAPDALVIAIGAPTFAGRSVSWDEIAHWPADAGIDAMIESAETARDALYMMTSGSTGLPKVVRLSLAAIAANTAQGIDLIGRAAGWDETLLDWLPWHHAAGASVYRATLIQGGTLYIDAGKPAPGLFDQSLANLREIPVAYFNNVPLGYAMLVEAMDTDTVLRDAFFAKMRLMLYGGAGLPQQVYDRLQAHAVAATGHHVHMTTGYGMTETVSGCCAIHFATDRVGIGLPAPGVEMKLVPNGVRYEVRLRGPNLMSGYLDEPAKTAEAFDPDGFYRTGDLVTFHDPADPGQGLAFAGRLAEEFKLSNGTWVFGGPLREGLLKALDGLVSEVVLADDGRPYLGLLAWPRPGATLAAVTNELAAFNAGQRGGSARVRRVRLLQSPPDSAAHEISDKGTINRRAALDNRHEDVAALFADTPGDGVAELL